MVEVMHILKIKQLCKSLRSYELNMLEINTYFVSKLGLIGLITSDSFSECD